MILKRQFFTALVLVCVCTYGVFGAVLEVGEIDRVYKKAQNGSVLDERDFEAIESFVASALEEMFLVDDFSEIVFIRREISSRKGGSEQNLYSVSFISSAKEHLEIILERAGRLEDGRRKTHLERNLVILVAELENLDLMKLSFAMLDHENGTVRYWAVKSIANSRLAGHLNSAATKNEMMEKDIITGLSKVAAVEKHPEIVDLIVRFAGQLNNSDAKELLVSIAYMRMRAYENWTVDYELMDAGILKALSAELLSPMSELDKSAVARQFAQFYSYVIQRFMLGSEVLSEVSKGQLASVIVEIEASVLEELLGKDQWQANIKKAVQNRNRNYSALERDRKYLLGGGQEKGLLVNKYKFNYGKDLEGKVITAPKELPGPPDAVVEAVDEG